MPVTYLNKQGKDQALALAAFIAYMDDRVIEWEARVKTPGDKLKVKYAKMAKSFTQKVLDTIFETVDNQQRFKLLGDRRKDKYGNILVPGEVDKMEVVVKYKDQAVAEYRNMAQLDETVTLPTADFIDIVSFALASCNLCDLCGDDVTNCDMRKLFLKHDADVLTADPGEGCPYRLQEGSALYQQIQEAARNAEA